MQAVVEASSWWKRGWAGRWYRLPTTNRAIVPAPNLDDLRLLQQTDGQPINSTLDHSRYFLVSFLDSHMHRCCM